MNNHYGFFNNNSNDMFASVQGVYLISSTSSWPKGAGSFKGTGSYLNQSNLRHCIALYCVRTIPKHSWVNSNNVYMGRESED